MREISPSEWLIKFGLLTADRGFLPIPESKINLRGEHSATRRNQRDSFANVTSASGREEIERRSCPASEDAQKKTLLIASFEEKKKCNQSETNTGHCVRIIGAEQLIDDDRDPAIDSGFAIQRSRISLEHIRFVFLHDKCITGQLLFEDKRSVFVPRLPVE